MTMTDRDKKIILLLIIIAVVVLPYVLYAKDTRLETENIKAETVGLNETLARLREMDQNREFYKSETARYNSERDAIIAKFPADINPANYTMFLLNTEYSSNASAPDENGIQWLEYPIRFDSVGYGVNEEYSITDGESAVQLDYTALSNRSAVTFLATYDSMKYMLEYLMSYPDPMIYTSIKISYDPDYNEIAGDFILEQYAIVGGDRTLPDVVIDPDIDRMGWRSVYSEDNPNGIVGPPTPEEVVEEEVVEDEEGEGEGEEDAGTN